MATEQYGFRKGISTENAAFRLTDVFKSTNQKMHVGRILCDFAKAWECLNNEIFLVKLHFYGILGVYEDWLRSCLTDRRQKVKVKSPNTTTNFFSAGVHRNMEFRKDQF